MGRFGGIKSGVRSIAPGGSRDYVFGGAAVNRARDDLGGIEAYNQEEENKTNAMLGQSNTMYGFGGSNEAFRNKQRIDNAATNRGTIVANMGRANADASAQNAFGNIRANTSNAGFAQSSAADQAKQQALSRYYSSIASAQNQGAAESSNYLQSLDAQKQQTDDMIRRRRIGNTSDLMSDRSTLRQSRDGAVMRGFGGFFNDVNAGLGGG